MQDFSLKLAEALRRNRLQLEMTQEQLANLSETDVRTIINMEMGRGNPKLETLGSVIRVLNMDAREIFDDKPQLESLSKRHMHLLIEDCSESEIDTLLPVIEAVLNALRSKEAAYIE